MPLLLGYVIDSGVVAGQRNVVVIGALGVAGLAVLDAVLGLVGRWASARVGEGLIYDLRPRCSTTFSVNRWPSSPAPRPARLSHG